MYIDEIELTILVESQLSVDIDFHVVVIHRRQSVNLDVVVHLMVKASASASASFGESSFKQSLLPPPQIFKLSFDVKDGRNLN